MMTIREATAADLPAIIRLLADDPMAAGREDLSEPVAPSYLAAFKEIDGDDGEMLVVGELDGEVVASLQLSLLPGLSRKGAWRAQIEAVRVASPLRGRGLGQELVTWAIDAARARGCTLVQLTTDRSRTDAHRFYERLGFQPTHVGMKLRFT
jgi:GNAT superfamily N-acetyltransferase